MDDNLQNDLLDARLRDGAAYIDDDGFTASVVQKLPARRVRRSLRAAILIGITLIASLIAYRLSGGGWFIAEGVTRFALLPLPFILLCAAGATVLVMAAGLFAASKGSARSR